MFERTLKRRNTIALSVVAVVVAVLPMLLVRHLPLVDYPNHLGSFQIWKTIGSSPALQRFYVFDWAFIPNLAVDLLIMPFSYLLPIEPAANLISLLALILLCVGTMALDRSLNGSRWGLSLFVGILLYNGAFRYGFINYIVGVSFAVVLFAVWVRFRPRWSWAVTLAFMLAGVVLLIMHLFAFGLYAVCVASYEFSRLLESARQSGQWRVPPFRQSLAVGLSLILPLSLLALSPTTGQAGVTRWSTPTWKLEALLSPVFFNHPHIELPLFAVLVLLLLLGWFTGALCLSRRMVWAMAVFTVLGLAMPRTLFGSNYADYRLFGGIGFFFLASLKLHIADIRGRYAILGVLTACLLVRVSSVAIDWLSVQPILDEYETALDDVPPGSRVLVLQGDSPSTSAARTPPLEHVPVFAIAKRQAFVAYVFTDKAVPIHLTPAFADYFHFAPYPEYARDMGRYDYVLAVQAPVFEVPSGLSLVPLAHGRTYVLNRVEHG